MSSSFVFSWALTPDKSTNHQINQSSTSFIIARYFIVLPHKRYSKVFTYFARKLINSVRLSLPAVLSDSPLQTPCDAPLRPGNVIADAPLRGSNGSEWLLDVLPPDFCLLHVGPDPMPDIDAVPRIGVGHRADYPTYEDVDGWAAKRYGTRHSYLIRPDGHICAAFETVDAAAVRGALARARGEAS